MDSLQVLLGNFSIIIATPHHFAVSQAGFQVEHKVILECSTDQYCLAILAMLPGGKIEPLGFVDFALRVAAVIAAAVAAAEGGVAQVSSQDLDSATKEPIVNVIAIAWQLLVEDGINFKYVSFVTLSIAVHKRPSPAEEGEIIKEESCYCQSTVSTAGKRFGLESVIIEWAVIAAVAADELLGLI